MKEKNVFECQCCGVCCQGEGGIYLPAEKASGPARILGITEREFIDRYTEPKYGQLALKTDQDGFCLLHDRTRHICSIHQEKPQMCRDWPFFWGMLHERQAFEDAKDACPGLKPEATWEEFKDWHRKHVGTMPPAAYVILKN